MSYLPSKDKLDEAVFAVPRALNSTHNSAKEYFNGTTPGDVTPVKDTCNKIWSSPSTGKYYLKTRGLFGKSWAEYDTLDDAKKVYFNNSSIPLDVTCSFGTKLDSHSSPSRYSTDTAPKYTDDIDVQIWKDPKADNWFRKHGGMFGKSWTTYTTREAALAAKGGARKTRGRKTRGRKTRGRKTRGRKTRGNSRT